MPFLCQFVYNAEANMKACDIFLAFSIHSLFSVCAAVSENKSSETPHASDEIDATETCKIELTPLFISAGLGDIIVLSAPIINNTKTFYYLSDPNGDSIKLNINASRITTDFKELSRSDNDYDYNATIYEGEVKTIMGTTKKRKIISLYDENYENNCLASYSDFDKQPNDFIMGPINEDDHGNWVLSLYYKGNDGDWMELFKVITIHIVESFPTYAPNIKLVPGQTFEPRFLYPINNLQSCEISPPRTAFDRFYDRDRISLDSCGFRIPNVTKDDEGLWTILGVGKLVYKGEVYLQIDDDDIL